MYVLYITKAPEFDKRDRLVTGQCEPDSSSWELRLYTGEKDEKLLDGSYAELGLIQTKCTGRSLDEVRKIARKEGKRLGD